MSITVTPLISNIVVLNLLKLAIRRRKHSIGAGDNWTLTLFYKLLSFIHIYIYIYIVFFIQKPLAACNEPSHH